jgi:hypothetical protein
VTQLAGIDLPADLPWVDEHRSWRMAQSRSFSVTGAQIIQGNARQAGRFITLQSGRGSGPRGPVFWGVVDLTTKEALQALADNPATGSMTLLLPQLNDPEETRSFTVRFRHEDVGFEAEPWKVIVPHRDADLFSITLRLITV